MTVNGPSEALVEAGYRLEIADAPILHRGLGLADLSHVQELFVAGVIEVGVAQALSETLLDFLEVPPDQFPYEPVYGDAYNSREKVLEERLGSVAGWLAAGRTRREAGRIAFRLALRSELLALHRLMTDFARSVVERARQYHLVIWNDTTYLQPAQPSSFGHFLGGFAEEAVRNLDRIEAAFRWANRSPAGVGGVAGTSLPFDRERMAQRLGFDGSAPHTRDAMWSVDGLTDSLVAATQSALTIDRLAEDLEIFASPQFGYISLAASASRASILLPQKRNPYALAVIRGGAGTLIGRTMGVLATQRTPSARTDNWLYAYGETVGSLRLAARLATLGTEVVREMAVDEETLSASAGAHFSVAADLAEQIMIRCEIDYRTAYSIVKGAAAAVQSFHVKEQDLMTAAASLGVALGEGLGVAVRAVADPAQLVASRDTLGGSAPIRVLEHCESVERSLQAHVAWADESSARIATAEATVIEKAKGLASQ